MLMFFSYYDVVCVNVNVNLNNLLQTGELNESLKTKHARETKRERKETRTYKKIQLE